MGHVELVGGRWWGDKDGSEDANVMSSLPLSSDYIGKEDCG